ncbi:hypothetical protein MWH28_11000 [Natroniella sulfidigena]|uniref:hypothetical protein n=1 Tax=Natroniella sulfidigena TaxID=723921 RepID=UPI00200A3529|nr:hypothetical protein [Natroniella sulfidigena]MCK8817891.1 hypothetical protein [Natroniella sulfidigena]
MLRLMGLLAIMLTIAFLQVSDLIQKGYYKDLFAFLGLWLMATVYASVVVLEIPLVSPFVLLTEIIEIILN